MWPARQGELRRNIRGKKPRKRRKALGPMRTT
jgi:hypothetical protein